MNLRRKLKLKKTQNWGKILTLKHTICTSFRTRYSHQLSKNGCKQVQNCPIALPSTEKWIFLPDLFGLGPEAKLEEIRSLLETLPMVQSPPKFGNENRADTFTRRVAFCTNPCWLLMQKKKKTVRASTWTLAFWEAVEPYEELKTGRLWTG